MLTIRGFKVLTVVAFVSGVYTARAQQIRSGIQGVVQDIDRKDAIAGAVVAVRNSSLATATDGKGTFKIPLAPGTYQIEIRFLGYKTLLRNITVEPGQMASIRFPLKSTSRELAQVSVEGRRLARTEKALLEIRRKSSVIQDAIGAEQIEKSASITSTQALQKVTGVSVRDGRYVTVRGLTDRNIVVQLNGSRLAGADASRSSVPLDLIPAQLLDNITVEKSVTPDKPGDATAAVIEVKTKGIPDSAFFQVSAQVGANSNIGPTGYYNSYGDASLGALGLKVQNLNLTQDFRRLIDEYTARGFSAQNGTLREALRSSIGKGSIGENAYKEALRIDKAAKSFTPNLATSPGRANPNKIFSLTYGNRKVFRSGKVLGFVLGLNYYDRYSASPDGINNRYSVRESARPSPNIILPNELNLLPLFNEIESTGIHQLNFGGLTSVAFRFNPANEITLGYTGNFGAEANASSLEGVINTNLRPSNSAATGSVNKFDHSRTYDFILRSEERPLHQFQARGEHRFKPLRKWQPWRVNWSASQSYARQNDPNYRDTRVVVDSLGRAVVNVGGLTTRSSDYQYGFRVSSTRYFRELRERNQNDKLDLNIPLKLLKQTSSLKFGGYLLDRKRIYKEASDERRDTTAIFNEGRGIDLNGRSGQVPENIVTLKGDLLKWSSGQQIGLKTSPNRGEGLGLLPGYLFVPRSGGNDYSATFRVVAFYGMGDLQLTKSLRAVGGMRIENTDIKAQPDTTGIGSPLKTVLVNGKPVERRINTQEEFDRFYKTNYLTYSWLPSGSLIYSGLKNMNFRLAYSKTITRPELNEIVNSSQFDPLQQASLRGNTSLRNGLYSSYDFRYDWFVRSEELISVSAFFKKVTDQIERIYLPADAGLGQFDDFGRSNATISFRNNLQPGYVYGLEAEIRKKLDALFPLGKYIIAGANFLLVRSTTKVDSAEYQVASLYDRGLSRTRPLIDQPNFVVNFNLGFDQPRWGTQMNLIFNKTGKRLVEINVDGSPNIYQYPGATLDFVFSQRFSKKLQLKLFGKNLLNARDDYRYTLPGNTNTYGVNGKEYARRRTAFGSEYTVGINYVF